MGRVNELVPKVARYLVSTAANHNSTTYLQVAKAVGTHQRVVPQVLEVVRSLCLQRGWPALTVLVFSKGKTRPGEAFLDPWIPRNASQAARDAMVDRFLEEVYNFDWSALLALYPEDVA